MQGSTNAISGKSNVEKVNLTLKTNQASHNDLVGTAFTVKYGTYTKSYNWDGNAVTIEIPGGTEYSITFNEVSGYATPSTLTYMAVSGNARSVNAVYKTELVSVTVNANNGESVAGQVVTINGTQHTWNGSAIAQKIPFGTVYTVSVNDKEGFITPESQSYTAEVEYRTVSLEFVYHPGTKNPSNGVYIQDIEGFCYTEAEWTDEYVPNGVAVITDNCRFVIALEDAYSSTCQWGGYGMTVSGITTATSKSEAQGDYDGEAQTTTILNTLNEGPLTAPAAECCRAYLFPDGSVGYMGAAGEWQAALDNKSAIISDLSKCGGDSMSYYYWTSTQESSNSSWCLRWDDKYLFITNKDLNRYVRAFAAI